MKQILMSLLFYYVPYKVIQFFFSIFNMNFLDEKEQCFNNSEDLCMHKIRSTPKFFQDTLIR